VILPDVNVLVYGFRRDAERHGEYRSWLSGILNGDSAFGVSEQVLAALVRVSTHPRVFQTPSPLGEALQFVNALRSHPLCRTIRPGERHWALFTDLCARSAAKGNLIPDAWNAALAIESGCVWITTDRDYARFPGLAWKHPLDHESVIENPA